MKNKKLFIIIGAILVLVLSGYLLYLVSPFVKAIGWVLLIAIFGVGIFSLAKFVLKLVNK